MNKEGKQNSLSVYIPLSIIPPPPTTRPWTDEQKKAFPSGGGVLFVLGSCPLFCSPLIILPPSPPLKPTPAPLNYTLFSWGIISNFDVLLSPLPAPRGWGGGVGNGGAMVV
jgi:hypothetical protein